MYFEARVLAIDAVAVVALHDHDFLRDVDDLLDGAEAHHVGDAREGFELVVRHAEAAADGDVEADELSVRVRDRDEAEIVAVDVDVVARRNRDDDFEFPRQIGFAVDRLHVLGFAAGDEIAADPDLVIGARARREVFADARA